MIKTKKKKTTQKTATVVSDYYKNGKFLKSESQVTIVFTDPEGHHFYKDNTGLVHALDMSNRERIETSRRRDDSDFLNA